MPHLSLQTGTAKDERDCPALCCMLDTGASLSTANFHYMEAVVRRYPHILKAIYLPDNYVAIVLSGIVTSSDAPITTELPVGFEIHLPYATKDGNDTSLLVAAGPDVVVNLILGLPFIKATSMIVDFINNVCQAKHLLCIPSPLISGGPQNQYQFWVIAMWQDTVLIFPRSTTSLESCAGTSLARPALQPLTQAVLQARLRSLVVGHHPSMSISKRAGLLRLNWQIILMITNIRSWGTWDICEFRFDPDQVALGTFTPNSLLMKCI
jgi:hypothetical protein